MDVKKKKTLLIVILGFEILILSILLLIIFSNSFKNPIILEIYQFISAITFLGILLTIAIILIGKNEVTVQKESLNKKEIIKKYISETLIIGGFSMIIIKGSISILKLNYTPIELFTEFGDELSVIIMILGYILLIIFFGKTPEKNT